MAYFEVNKKPPLSFPTLTGSIVTFNSQYAGLPLKSHTVEVVATQSGSGTPSPQNIRSINGVSNIGICNWGANIPDIVFTNNLTILTDGSVTSNPDHQVSDFVDISNITSGYVVIQSPTLNLRNNGLYTAFSRIAFYDDNEDFISLDEKQGVTLFYTSIPTGAKYARFMCGGKATDILISGASAATIQIGSTVYGGEYDARTGALTVTQVKEILRGSYFVTYSASIQCAGGGKPAGWLPWLKQTGGSCEMLSHGLPTTRSNIGNISNGCFIGDTTGGNREVMYIKFAGYSSLEDVQTFIEAQYNSNTPVEVVYELATPITIQLPPCPIDVLEGQNNIWADTGDTTLQYPKFG